MATPSYVESLICSAKRLRISQPSIRPVTHRRHLQFASSTPRQAQVNNDLTTRVNEQEQELRKLRLPKAVQAVFLAPLKRAPTHGIPVCDLQIRSYSIRNVEVFADFCLRAAYYLNLAAKGPVTLPRITERWTVPRSHFIFKKSQENFERITRRRLIQIQDGHPETVAIWLAYIQKHRYYGVGMKANIYEHGSMDVAADLEKEGRRIQDTLGESIKLLGEGFTGSLEGINQVLHNDPTKEQWGASGPMSGLAHDKQGRKRFQWQAYRPKADTPGISYPEPAANKSA